MRNKYPGICYRCSKLCEAGQGHFEKVRGGWRIQHADCAIKHRGTRFIHPKILDKFHKNGRWPK